MADAIIRPGRFHLSAACQVVMCAQGRVCLFLKAGLHDADVTFRRPDFSARRASQINKTLCCRSLEFLSTCEKWRVRNSLSSLVLGAGNCWIF